MPIACGSIHGLQDRPQRLDDAVGMVVIQHAINTILTLTLARFSAEQVATIRVAVLGFALRRHRESLLNSLVGFLLRHNKLDGCEIRNFNKPPGVRRQLGQRGRAL